MCWMTNHQDSDTSAFMIVERCDNLSTTARQGLVPCTVAIQSKQTITAKRYCAPESNSPEKTKTDDPLYMVLSTTFCSGQDGYSFGCSQRSTVPSIALVQTIAQFSH